MQATPGREIRIGAKRLFLALLTLSLLVWSLAPSFAHPTETTLTAAQVEERHHEHGHAHDDGVDAYWLVHGHSHDVADHDHSSAILTRNPALRITGQFPLPDPLAPFMRPPDPVYLPERPPRV